MTNRNSHILVALFVSMVFCSFIAQATTRILKIKIASTSYSDEIAIRYMSGATTGYDGCCDAWKFFSGNLAVPNLFTRTDAGDDLAINSLPSLNNNNDVDLFVRTGATATYSFTPTQVDSFSASTQITLIDNVTGITYDLRTANTYTINLPVIAVGAAARFTVKVIPPPVVMPVELIQFTAHIEKQDVLLNWTTATEENNKSFIVERAVVTGFSGSGDMDFVSVGNLPGAGNSSTERNYKFVDRPEFMDPGNCTLYYRIKQTDFNGNYKYFGPIAVARPENTPSELNVYPSASIGRFFISGNATATGISIYTHTGQEVYSNQVQGLSVTEPFKIEMLHEANGIYFLKMTTGDETRTKKIIFNH